MMIFQSECRIMIYVSCETGTLLLNWTRSEMNRLRGSILNLITLIAVALLPLQHEGFSKLLL